MGKPIGITFDSEFKIFVDEVEYIRRDKFDELYEKFVDSEIARIQAELKLTEIRSLLTNINSILGKDNG